MVKEISLIKLSSIAKPSIATIIQQLPARLSLVLDSLLKIN